MASPIRTAREAFLASPQREPFERITETAAFQEACHLALLTYVEEMQAMEDLNGACMAHARVSGAKAVLDVLRTLHLKPEKPEPYTEPFLRAPS